MARDQLISELARAQYGLITRAQALAAGVHEGTIDRRTRTREWEVAGRAVPGSDGARSLDNVGAWMSVAPAIDFTAGVPLAVARAMTDDQ